MLHRRPSVRKDLRARVRKLANRQQKPPLSKLYRGEPYERMNGTLRLPRAATAFGNHRQRGGDRPSPAAGSFKIRCGGENNRIVDCERRILQSEDAGRNVDRLGAMIGINFVRTEVSQCIRLFQITLTLDSASGPQSSFSGWLSCPSSWASRRRAARRCCEFRSKRTDRGAALWSERFSMGSTPSCALTKHSKSRLDPVRAS